LSGDFLSITDFILFLWIICANLAGNKSTNFIIATILVPSPEGDGNEDAGWQLCSGVFFSLKIKHQGQLKTIAIKPV